MIFIIFLEPKLLIRPATQTQHNTTLFTSSLSDCLIKIKTTSKKNREVVVLYNCTKQQQQVALITLPPPSEVARPEMPRDSVLSTGRVDEEEWVTVFGYVASPLADS